MKKLFFYFSLFFLFFFIGTGEVKAVTYYGSYSATTATANKSTYSPGETIVISAVVFNIDSQVMPGGTFMAGIDGDMGTWATIPSDTNSVTVYLTAPSTPGNYTLWFGTYYNLWYPFGAIDWYGTAPGGGVTITVSPPTPTASVSVSPSPVPYGTNPGFTLSSTNAYYCYVYMDMSQNVATGYFTSGTYYPGALTSVGAHTANSYCYNSAWVGSGWSTTNFTVSTPPPTMTNVTISSGIVVTDATSQYTITSTASNYNGGGLITDELALINYQGVNAGYYRGYLGWSSIGFYFFGGSYKITPIACSGGGSATIYNGYGPEYINLVSCSTSVSGNTRTVSYVVTFNTNFTSPINSNTLSGFAYNNSTGLYSGWSPFSSFTITPTCSNGANNYPTCNTCSTPLGWNGSICTTCSNGGCTNGVCNNGANNPVSCNTCSTPLFVWQSSTSSCIPATPPTASIVSPAIDITIFENQSQQFTGSATDADGTVIGYEWRSGNCSTGTILSSLLSFVRSFSAGTYTVYFRAQDNMGLWSTNCPSRTITVNVNNPVDGVCGSAHGIPSQRKPTANLCNTAGLPGPTVLPENTSVLPENGVPSSWTWTCVGEYNGTNASCSSNTSCGNGNCQPSRGESPATCRADCRVRVEEF